MSSGFLKMLSTNYPLKKIDLVSYPAWAEGLGK